MTIRAALLILGLATACGGRAAPAPTIANTAAQDAPVEVASGLRDGALWTCQIDDYDPQPCKLSRDGSGWRLAKLLGSQRFRGAVVFRDGGARFLGEYFCPWGDCTMAIDVDFTRDEDGGAYVGQARTDGDIQPPTLRLQYDQANEAQFGGAGYGGLTGDEQ